jgi:hypothetical protein
MEVIIDVPEGLEKVKEALEEKIKRDFNVKIGEYSSDESKSGKKVMETKGAVTCST